VPDVVSEQLTSPFDWSVDPASTVTGIARSGNTIYICGNFLTVGHAYGSGVPVDADNGAPLHPFPRVAGPIFKVVPDGRNGWFVAGGFTAVGGLPRSNLAHIFANGAVDAWCPEPNGIVSDMALNGGVLYLSGEFTLVGGRPRRYLAGVNARTGVVTDWRPEPDNFVQTILPVRNRVYVGGNFSNIGGKPVGMLAALDASTGIADDWSPMPDREVTALAWGDSVLYVGGFFTNIGGQPRTLIAALDPASGAATAWHPDASRTPENVFDGGARVLSMVLTNGAMFVGGAFNEIGGQPRTALAQVDLVTGAATNWDAEVLDRGFFFPAIVYSIAVRESTLYVAGRFTGLGGQSNNGNGGLGDSYAGAVDLRSARALGWNPNPDGQVLTLAPSGDRIFLGGYFGSLWDWKYRPALAALDVETGAPKPWDPALDGPVYRIAVQGSTVYVAGSFSHMGGQPRTRLAALDAVTAVATPWNPGCDGPVHSLALGDSVIYVGGIFQNVGGSPRNSIAALDTSVGTATSWNPDVHDLVLSIAVANDVVYVGGDFNTVGGQRRSSIAAIDRVTGLATDWNPGSSSIVEALAAVDTVVFAGGSFSGIGGQSRQSLAALSSRTGLATSWRADIGNDDIAHRSVISLAANDSIVYVGGPFVRVGDLPRLHLAAVDAVTGTVLDWAPNPDGNVWSLCASEQTVYVGGNFSSLGSLSRGCFAALSTPAFRAFPEPSSEPSLALLQNWPNPSSSKTAIQFALPTSGPVRLSVFDIQGRRIATMAQDALCTAGVHEVDLSTAGWAAGCYVYRLEFGGRVASRRMLVIH
jgi:hypothetical protein